LFNEAQRLTTCYEQVIYPEDITVILRKNEQQSIMCHVERYDRQSSKFDVKEMATSQRCRPMSFTVKLNERWCDCGEFQALRLPCAHVMAVYSYSYLNHSMCCCPYLHCSQHFQGLRDRVSSNSKSRLLVSLNRFKSYT